MKRKMISIIIPLYNEEDNILFLESNLKSALIGMNDSEFEIIMVDAGSTDKTKELICEKFNSKNISIITKQRMFPGKSRNEGVNKAKGEILVFMDAGIEYEKGYIKKITNPIVNDEYEVVWGKLERKPKNFLSKVLVDLTYSTLSLKVIPAMSISKSMMNKIGRFREDLRALEDTEYIRRIEAMNVKEYKDKKIKCHYYDFPTSRKKIFDKWITYNEYTVYSGLRKKKEFAALIANIFFLSTIIFNKLKLLILPLYIILTLIKFRKKRISVKKRTTELFKYVQLSFIIDIATYVGLTKGIFRKYTGLWK